MCEFTNSAAAAFINAMPHHEPASLRARFPHANPAALNLLQRMLTFAPGKRISAVQALQHEYFDWDHELVEAAPEAPDPPSIFTRELDEREGLGTERAQAMVWREVRVFHPEIGPFPGRACREE
jgi:hypothetical protein